MRFDILRQPLAITLLLFVLFSGVFWIRFTYMPWPGESLTETMLPIEGYIRGFSTDYPLFSQVAALVLIFATALFISRTISRNMVLASRTYLPIIIYLIVSCGVVFAGADLRIVLAALLVVRSMEYFISGFVRSTSFDTTFRGAFLIGTIPLLYAPAAIYLLAVPAALIVFRRKGREAVVAAISCLIPLLVYAYIMWALGEGFGTVFINLADTFQSFSLPGLASENITEILKLAVLCIMGILTLLGLVSFALMSGSMRTRATKILTFSIFLLCIGLLGVFFGTAVPYTATLLAIPASVIIPAFFGRFTGWPAVIAYFSLLGSVLALNLLPLLAA